MVDKKNTKAWVVGVGAIVMAVFTIFPTTSFSLLLRPISESLGVSIGSVSLTYSISAAAGFFGALSIGNLLKRFNPKILVIVGGIFMMTYMVTISFATSIIPLYITVFFKGLGGIMSGMTMAQISLAQWFSKARATMISVCSIGISIAGAVFVPVMANLIATVGYRTVTLWEGIIVGTVVILCGIFCISGPPEKYGLKPYGYEEPSAKSSTTATASTAPPKAALTFSQIIRMPVFWSVVLCTLVGSMAAQSFSSQGSSFFQSIGLDAVNAAYALSVFSLASMGWNLLFGIVSDKASPLVGALISGGVAAAAFLLAFLWTGWIGAIIAAICMASVAVISGILGPTMMAKLFGTKEAGGTVGFVRAGSSLGAMIGPAVAGFLFDSSGSYTVCFTIMGAALVLVLILSAWAGSKKTALKIKEKQEMYAATASSADSKN